MQKLGTERLSLLPQAFTAGNSGAWTGGWAVTPQPGAPLGPSALSQEQGFAEATLSPFHLPTLTPSPLFGIICGQY